MPIEKPKTHIARRDKLKKSPVPWIVLICISFLIFFLFGYGKMNDWNTKKKEIVSMGNEIETFNNEIESLKIDIGDLQLDFEELAGPQLERERKVFPPTLDSKKVVRVIELFSIQLLNILDQRKAPVFSLNSLNLNTAANDPEFESTQKMPITLNVTSDQASLETLIQYLQTNEIPDRMKTAYEQRQLDTDDYIVIENNPLPIMLISTITKSPAGEDGDTLNVSISGHFYFQTNKNTDDSTPALEQ